LDGEEAFGVKDKPSVFTQSLIDALSFAAADSRTARNGKWPIDTAEILKNVDLLIASRVPLSLRTRMKPNALNIATFNVNEIDEPTETHSFITLADLSHWGKVRIECVNAQSGTMGGTSETSTIQDERCVRFKLADGRWKSRGVLPNSPPSFREDERHVRPP